MTQEEFEAACKDICLYCKAGVAVRQREDTREWVHDIFRGNAVSHSICMATHYRNKYKDSLSA